MHDPIEVTLPDGQTVWAVVADQGPRDVAGRVGPRALRGLTETLRGVASNVRAGLRDARPDEVSVEFGVELALAEEGLVAALAGISGNATIQVTLTWSDKAPAGAGE